MSSSMESYQSDHVAQFQGGNPASQVGQAMSCAGARPLALKGSELPRNAMGKLQDWSDGPTTTAELPVVSK